jgi:hypothetical protein
MQELTYVMKIDWRRATASVLHPEKKLQRLVNNALPYGDLTFLSLDDLRCSIHQPEVLRQWLHGHRLRYSLYGRYEYWRGHFQTHTQFDGLVLVFKQPSGLWQFQDHWNRFIIPYTTEPEVNHLVTLFSQRH